MNVGPSIAVYGNKKEKKNTGVAVAEGKEMRYKSFTLFARKPDKKTRKYGEKKKREIIRDFNLKKVNGELSPKGAKRKKRELLSPKLR